MSNVSPQLPINPLIYEDFDIEITYARDPGKIRVHVKGTADSSAAETIAFPAHLPVLETWHKEWRSSLSRSDSPPRHLRWYQEDSVVRSIKELGQYLFKAVFVEKILSLYDSRQQSARQGGKNLRVKLHIEPPELAVLPWEFLYNIHRNDYLVLQGIPLVRMVDVAEPVPLVTIKRPIRILGVAVAPSGLQPLDIDLEQKAINQALSNLRIGGLIDLVWINGTRDLLDDAMTKGSWHAFHFIGHGAFNKDDNTGTLALSGEDGKVDWLTSTELARLLANQHSLRAVVLNACEGAMGSTQDLFSSMAVTLMKQNIPAVLAMQYRISDKAAIEFAQNFYRALAEGQSLATAVTAARHKMARGKSIEWGVPVLYMRGPDGPFFAFSESTAEPSPPLSPKNIDTPVVITPGKALNQRNLLSVIAATLLGLVLLIGVVVFAPNFLQNVFSPLLPTLPFASFVEIGDQGEVVSAKETISFPIQQGDSVRIKIIIQDGSAAFGRYHWSFIPSDPVNADVMDSATDTIDYVAPSDQRGQLIRVEVESSGYKETILMQVVINRAVAN